MPAAPEYWDDAELAQLATDAASAYQAWRASQATAEQQTFASTQAEFQQRLSDLLNATNDLINFTATAFTAPGYDVRRLVDTARYLAAAPISREDLSGLSGYDFKGWLSHTSGRQFVPIALPIALNAIRVAIPPTHAPWLVDGRTPSAQQRNRLRHIVSSLYAAQRVETIRRSSAASRQEAATREALAAAGYAAVEVRGALQPATLLTQMPLAPGGAAGSYLTKRKSLAGKDADVLVRLRPGHGTGASFLILECKVSATRLNSRKRINDCIEKVGPWSAGGLPGTFRVGAVLGGEFSVDDLKRAQQNGILLFFDHQLADLTTFA